MFLLINLVGIVFLGIVASIPIVVSIDCSFRDCHSWDCGFYQLLFLLIVLLGTVNRDCGFYQLLLLLIVLLGIVILGLLFTGTVISRNGM